LRCRTDRRWKSSEGISFWQGELTSVDTVLNILQTEFAGPIVFWAFVLCLVLMKEKYCHLFSTERNNIVISFMVVWKINRKNIVISFLMKKKRILSSVFLWKKEYCHQFSYERKNIVISFPMKERILSSVFLWKKEYCHLSFPRGMSSNGGWDTGR
jgi:hypothetical protein